MYRLKQLSTTKQLTFRISEYRHELETKKSDDGNVQTNNKKTLSLNYFTTAELIRQHRQTQYN